MTGSRRIELYIIEALCLTTSLMDGWLDGWLVGDMVALAALYTVIIINMYEKMEIIRIHNVKLLSRSPKDLAMRQE